VWRFPTRVRVAIQLLLLVGMALAGVAQQAVHPLSKSQIVDLLVGGVPARRVSILATQRGIDFEPSDEDLETLRRAGADDDVLNSVRKAKRIFPEQLRLQALRAQARQLAESGNYAEAEKQYGAALFLAPKDPELNWAMGNVQLKQKKWNLAAASYRHAVEGQPNNAEWHCDLGSALRQGGDATGALEQFKLAAGAAPGNPRPYEEIGAMFADRGDWRQALIAYRALAELKPNSPEAQANLGRALRNTGDLKGAIAAFRQAIRLAPNDPVAHNNLGYALEESGDFKGAAEEYKRASELAPGDAAIRANLDRISQRMRPPSLKR
jgi:Flp pilus assembly protein TadD